MQIALKGKAEGDPRVNKAMKDLLGQLQPTGILQEQNKERLYQFRGALQDALDVFQQQNKKVPNYKEVNEIGSRLLRQMVDPTKWFSPIFTRTSNMFEAGVPLEVMEKELADPYWKDADPEQAKKLIQRKYISEQYKRLYQKKIESSKPE
jgi:hypothetical protein